MFGEVARADPLQRPQHMTEDLGGRGEGRLGSTALHVGPPTLTGLHLFRHHQQEFTVLSSQVMFEKFPTGTKVDERENEMLVKLHIPVSGPCAPQ